MGTTEVARKRSPGYPQLGLDRAVQMAHAIYDAVLDGHVDTETMLHLMGYRGVSGPSRSSLAALKHFGLVEGRDQALRLTKLAVRIVHPLSETEQAISIREAADSPEIFREIRGQFGGRLPADPVVKAYLVRQHSFNPTGADALLRSIKETQAFVDRFRHLEPETAQTPSGEPTDSGEEVTAESLRSVGTTRLVSKASEEVHQVRISPHAIAIVEFKGAVTAPAIDQLIRYLEFTKANYPENEASIPNS